MTTSKKTASKPAAKKDVRLTASQAHKLANETNERKHKKEVDDATKSFEGVQKQIHAAAHKGETSLTEVSFSNESEKTTWTEAARALGFEVSDAVKPATEDDEEERSLTIAWGNADPNAVEPTPEA